MEQQGGNGKATIELLPKVNEYLGLIMTLIFAFGLVFQLPVVMTLLGRAGLVSSDMLKSKRKYAIVIAFVVAAVLTPPDPISQIEPGAPDAASLRDIDPVGALHRAPAQGRGGESGGRGGGVATRHSA